MSFYCLSVFIVVVFYFITKDVKGNAYLSCLSMLHLVKKAGIGQFVNSWENLKQLMCQIGKSGAAMESSFCVTRANWFENLKTRLHSVNSNNRNFINQCLFWLLSSFSFLSIFMRHLSLCLKRMPSLCCFIGKTKLRMQRFCLLVWFKLYFTFVMVKVISVELLWSSKQFLILISILRWSPGSAFMGQILAVRA